MVHSGYDPWRADAFSDGEKYYSQKIPASAPVDSEYINKVRSQLGVFFWWWISDKLICKLFQSSFETLAFHEWKGHL